MAVTILANPETPDFCKKRQHSYIVSLFYSQIICIHWQLQQIRYIFLYLIQNMKSGSIAIICYLANSNIQPIYAVWWFKLVTNVVLNWYADLSQNALKSFVLKM